MYINNKTDSDLMIQLSQLLTHWAPLFLEASLSWTVSDCAEQES